MENRHSRFSLQPNSENEKLAVVSAAVMPMRAKIIAKLLKLHAVQHVFKLGLYTVQRFSPPWPLHCSTFFSFPALHRHFSRGKSNTPVFGFLTISLPETTSW
jgi:hypothetical protein